MSSGRASKTLPIIVALSLLTGACAPATPPAPTAAPAAPPKPVPTQVVAPTVAATVAPTVAKPSQPTPNPTPTAVAQPAINRQNTLIVATPEDIIDLDPPFGGNDLSSEVDWQMYELPVNYVFAKQDGNLVQQGDKTEPWMADKVDVGADGRTITFHVRKGVKFYPSGREMTVKDLDWTFRRNLEIKGGFGKFTMDSASISTPGKIVDDSTYQVSLDKANVAALAILALIDTPLIDSEEAQKHATTDDPWAHEYIKRNSLGTGPYYLASFKPGQEVVLDAVPNYWRKPPYFQRIVYRIVPDPSARLALLRAGEIDIAEKLPGQALQSLQGVSGVTVRQAASPRVQVMFMNVASGPTADPNVRKAIAWAVPYKDILNVAFLGAGRLHDSFFSSTAFGYLPGPGYTQDLEKAKQFLSQSSSPGGFDVDLAIDSVVQEHEQAAVLVQTALKDLNINVNIVKKPTAQFRTEGNNRQHQIAIHTMITWIQEGTYLVNLRLTPKAITNWSGVNLPEIEQILPTLYTPDAAVRKAGYERAQQLWNEQVPDVVFAQMDQQVATASTIQDYVFSVTSLPQFYLMSRS